jgi:hypothetical protein
MSDLKPLSQNKPGERPARLRTAIRRASLAFPTSMKLGASAGKPELVINVQPSACLSEPNGPSTLASQGRRTCGATRCTLFRIDLNHPSRIGVVGVTKMPLI